MMRNQEDCTLECPHKQLHHSPTDNSIDLKHKNRARNNSWGNSFHCNRTIPSPNHKHKFLRYRNHVPSTLKDTPRTSSLRQYTTGYTYTAASSSHSHRSQSICFCKNYNLQIPGIWKNRNSHHHTSIDHQCTPPYSSSSLDTDDAGTPFRPTGHHRRILRELCRKFHVHCSSVDTVLLSN